MRVNLLNAAVDFDGVLCKFEGWQGEFTFGEPVPGSAHFLAWLSERYRVVVHTARPDIAEVYKWLNKHGMVQYVDAVSNVKEPAAVYIDDRAVCFNGDFNVLREQVENFVPWWKTEKEGFK